MAADAPSTPAVEAAPPVAAGAAAEAAPGTTARPPLRARLKALLEEYGRLAVMIYLAMFVLVFAGFLVAIRAGVHVESTAGGASLVGAAWLATKLTQPLRILGTLALVPIVARLRSRPSLTK